MNDLHIQTTLARPGFALDVDVRLPLRGITAVFGASGSGKTTLLRIVAGLTRPDRGRIALGEKVWLDTEQGINLPTHQRPVGMVFQEPSLLSHLSVAGNLMYAQRRSPKPHPPPSDIIKRMAIEGLLPRHSSDLSGGERQRVALARALITQPQLLLLDEPLAAVDHAHRQDILPWLTALRDQLDIPMLYVTHALDEVIALADTLLVLRAGQVQRVGPVEAVLADITQPGITGADASVRVCGLIHERDAQWGLLSVKVGDGCLWLRDDGRPVGSAVRLRILARDVSISRQRPEASSIQNILPARVDGVADAQPDDHPSQVLLRLRCGEMPLLARITHRARAQLDIQPGDAVWAQIKAVALAG